MSHTKRSDYARREEHAFEPIALVLIFVLPAVLILAGVAVVHIAVFSRTVGRPACARRLTRAIGGRGSVS